MNDMTSMKSLACPTRKHDLIEVSSGDDLLLYDGESHRAYCLNAQAATLWRRCDGMTPVDHLLDAEDGTAWEALRRLSTDGLIEGAPPIVQPHDFNRRAFMQAGGAAVAGAVMMPLIQSVLVPTPAAAASAFNGDQGGSGDGLGDSRIGLGDSRIGKGGPRGGKGPHHRVRTDPSHIRRRKHSPKDHSAGSA